MIKFKGITGNIYDAEIVKSFQKKRTNFHIVKLVSNDETMLIRETDIVDGLCYIVNTDGTEKQFKDFGAAFNHFQDTECLDKDITIIKCIDGVRTDMLNNKLNPVEITPLVEG